MSLQFHLIVDNFVVFRRNINSGFVPVLLFPSLFSADRPSQLEVHFGRGLHARLAVACVIFALGGPLSSGCSFAFTFVDETFPHGDIVALLAILIVLVHFEVGIRQRRSIFVDERAFLSLIHVHGHTGAGSHIFGSHPQALAAILVLEFFQNIVFVLVVNGCELLVVGVIVLAERSGLFVGLLTPFVDPHGVL